MEGLTGNALNLLAVLFLVLANGFFVAAEFSLVSVRRTRVEELVAAGNEAARAVRKAMDDPDRFIAATQLGITVASLGLGWIGEPALAHLIGPLVGWLPDSWRGTASHSMAAGLAFFLITFLHVVVGELAPKSIALQYPEETAFIVARPTLLAENVFRPLIWLLNGAGNGLLRLVGLRAPAGHQRVHSVEELKMLIAASEREGVLEAEETHILQRAFDFSDRRVQEAMIPRPEVVGVPAEATIADLLRTFHQAPHSRFPVYEGDLDHIVGVVSVKDVLHLLGEDQAAWQRSVRDLARPALFVPETKPVGDLFAEMRERQVQMAVVLDEYGGTAGIVTAEELVEEIVGRMSDEWVAEREVIWVDEETAEIDALMRVDEVNGELGLNLPENENYETVAGFLLYRLGRIPEEGERYRYGDLVLTVTRREGPKIARVQVRRLRAKGGTTGA